MRMRSALGCRSIHLTSHHLEKLSFDWSGQPTIQCIPGAVDILAPKLEAPMRVAFEERGFLLRRPSRGTPNCLELNRCSLERAVEWFDKSLAARWSTPFPLVVLLVERECHTV